MEILPIQRCWFSDFGFPVNRETCNRSPDAWPGFSWPLTGSSLCSSTKMLPIQILGKFSVFVQGTCSDKLSCTSQMFGPHEIACESDRRCNVDRECFQMRCFDCSLEGFFNPRNQIRNRLDSRRQQICHVIIFCLTAERPPDSRTLGFWDSLRRDDHDAFFYLHPTVPFQI